MKNTKRIILISLISVLCFLTVKVEAKWWIFGQSEDEVGINYMYLNQIPYDEIDAKVTLYKDSLQDGMIYIKGKASVKKGKIGAVQISIDGKEKWEKAKLSNDGTFLFSFKPEISKTYNIYVKVIDTRGKTNSVDLTHKEITISDRDIQSLVKDVLNQMIEAYKVEDVVLFMSYVSDDFVSDTTVLDRAIRNDFSAFDNIDLRYTLNNLISDSKGMIFVSLNFNRMVISTKSGKSLTDKGTTEFVFKLGDKGPKVYNMKNPLIFGLSDASNIATGTVAVNTNDPIIIINENGTTETKPFNEAIKIITEGEGSSTVESGTNITLISHGHPPAGFSFVDGETTEGSGDFIITGFCSPTSAYGFLDNGVTIADLGVVSLSSISEAPPSGYSVPTTLCFAQGNSYAFKLANGKYAIIEVKSVSVNYTVFPHSITIVFDYKYQTDGSRNF